jgi:SAM-dependent methyltransferase
VPQAPDAGFESDSPLVARLHRAGAAAVGVVPHERARGVMLRRYRRVLHRGDAVECPLCGGRYRHFMSAWNRPGAICWGCGAHERHRALWLVLERRPELLARARTLLHLAPEWCLQRRLRPRVGAGYVRADLEPGKADRVLDLLALEVADGAFDAIVCIHVLEHVEDDAVAMRELRRVVAPGGWAIVMVPLDLTRERTYEDPSKVTPAEREAAFWQHDHVRLYGRDLPERLAAAGFDVTTILPADLAGPRLTARYGLIPDERVFLCVA